MEIFQQNIHEQKILDVRNLEFLLSEAEGILSMVQLAAGERKPRMSALVQLSIRQGIERRDTEALSKRFHSWSNGKGFLSAEQLESCLSEIGVHSDGFVGLLGSMDLNDDGKVDLSEFQWFVASQRSEIARWADSIPLADFVADAFSAVVVDRQNPLKELGRLSDDTFSAVFESMVPFMRSLLFDALQTLQKSNDVFEEYGSENRASKFEVSVLSTGDVEDFHRGLEGRIGSMALNFETAMKLEHCCENASKLKFETPNYLITTDSDREFRLVMERRGRTEAEWMQIVQEKFSEVGLGDNHHGRRIPDVDSLMKLAMVVEAELNLMEVVAVVLYTGPMFFPYNTELRHFPQDLHQRLKAECVSFVTTIHVLVSAVQKIGRSTRVPEGTVLYRGLGGKCLPVNFHKADSKGRKGFTEWGFMSTTAERKMALQYSGVQAGSHAVALKIRTGAVDRGACIQELSQYVGEAEYLWLPLSLLEPGGEPSLEASPHGLVLVFPVRVLPNLKAVTVEENVSRKKGIHLTAFRYNLAEAREQLLQSIRQPNAVKRFSSDNFKDFQGNHTLEGLVESILKKFEAVVDRHALLDAAEYIHDDVYRVQVMDMLQTQTCATSFLRLYLEDKSQEIWSMSGKSLLEAHRGLMVFYRRHLALAQTDEEKRGAATKVCQLRGLIRLAVDEQNEDGEPVGVSAAADGLGRGDLRVLIQAGAFKDVEVAGRALRSAAKFGHMDALEVLVDDIKVAVDAIDQVIKKIECTDISENGMVSKGFFSKNIRAFASEELLRILLLLLDGWDLKNFMKKSS